MKALLFILIFFFVQEPDTVRVDTVKVVPKLDIQAAYRSQNIKLDSIIATKNAIKKYNLQDTLR